MKSKKLTQKALTPEYIERERKLEAIAQKISSYKDKIWMKTHELTSEKSERDFSSLKKGCFKFSKDEAMAVLVGLRTITFCSQPWNRGFRNSEPQRRQASVSAD